MRGLGFGFALRRPRFALWTVRGSAGAAVGPSFGADKEKPPASGGFIYGFPYRFGTVSLHLYGGGFGECEAEDGLGRQDDLFVPGVGRSRGSRTRTRCCTNERSLPATGETTDEGSGASPAADQGRAALSFALEVASDRICFHVVDGTVNRYGREDEPESGATLEAALRHGFNDCAGCLGPSGHCYPAAHFDGLCNRGAEAVTTGAHF